MSTADGSNPPEDPSTSQDMPTVELPRPGIRRWPAIAIIVGAGLLIAALQFAPGEQLPAQYRNLLTIILGTAALAALLFWLALFSRIPARPRAVAVVVFLAIPFALVRGVEFTGDIVPQFTFRWDPDSLEILEAHRRKAAQAPASDTPADDLDADFPAFRGADRSGVYRGIAIRTRPASLQSQTRHAISGPNRIAPVPFNPSCGGPFFWRGVRVAFLPRNLHRSTAEPKNLVPERALPS